MSKEATIWLAILAVGAINYVARLSFIALFARRDMPPLLDPGNAKLIAAVAALAVAAWRQSTTLTIVVGMAVLWLAQYALR